MFINFRDTRLKEIVLSQAEKQKQSFTDVLQNRCSQENTCFGVSFLKSCRLKACNFFKTRLQTGVFQWSLLNFWEHLFLRNTSGGCFWRETVSCYDKIMSLLNCVPYVLTCQRALRAFVLTCQCALRAYVLTCQRVLRAYVPKCTACLHAHVPTCLACLRARVPTYFACLRTHMSTYYASHVLTACLLCVLTCQRALRALCAYVLTCYNYK